MIARAVVLLAASCILSAGDATKKDLDRIQGEWKPVSVTINGERVNAKVFSADRMLIKNKAFVQKAGGKTVAGTFELDASKSPPHIDEESPGPEEQPIKSVGIYELDGDTLKVCYAVAPKARPRAFKAEEGSFQALVIYHRVK